MKVNSLILGLGLGLVCAVKSAIASPINSINWQDEKLKACVVKLARKNNWLDTQEVDAIKCHGKGITQGDDLRHFANLQNLSLFNNKIKSLDLTKLTQLQQLNLAKNRLVEVDIRGLSQLKTLYLFRNKLTTVNLQGLVNVDKFRITQNKLTQIDIRPMKALKQGYLFDNQLEDLPIDGLDQLEFLDVRQNPMPDELYDFYDSLTGVVISHDGNADDWK